MEIGDRIRAAREHAGSTQIELARQLNVTTQAVQQWEKNRTSPRLYRIQQIAAALSCDPVWLQTGTAPDTSHVPRAEGALDQDAIREILDIVTRDAHDDGIALSNDDIAYHIAANYQSVATEREHERRYRQRIVDIVRSRTRQTGETQIAQSSEKPGGGDRDE